MAVAETGTTDHIIVFQNHSNNNSRQWHPQQQWPNVYCSHQCQDRGNNTDRTGQTCIYCKLLEHCQQDCWKGIQDNKLWLDSNGWANLIFLLLATHVFICPKPYQDMPKMPTTKKLQMPSFCLCLQTILDVPNIRIHANLFRTLDKRHKYILSITDAFSKYAFVVSLENK